MSLTETREKGKMGEKPFLGNCRIQGLKGTRKFGVNKKPEALGPGKREVGMCWWQVLPTLLPSPLSAGTLPTTYDFPSHVMPVA